MLWDVKKKIRKGKMLAVGEITRNYLEILPILTWTSPSLMRSYIKFRFWPTWGKQS